MSTEVKEKTTKILIKHVPQLLSVKLTDEELRQSGDELAATVQEIDAEEDHQKNIKDQLKTRLSELTSKQSRLAFRISHREEFRDVQVAIEMHPDGRVSETRIDTGQVLVLREAFENEKQLPLGDEETAEVEPAPAPEDES